MASKFPSNLPTADDWTSANAGMGRTKSNKNDPNDLDHNYRAEEYNQQNLEIIAVTTKVGTDLSEPASYGDSCLDSHDEILRFLTVRADRAGFTDHICCNAFPTEHIDDIGAVGALGTDADTAGCANIVLAAGADTGYTTAAWLFRQRYTLSRFRLKFATGGTLPIGVVTPDYIHVGVARDATHYTWFESHCTNAVGPVWSDWTCEVNDGGATDSDVMTVGPTANTWRTFEILTHTTGATFWWERGTASEQKIELTAQAPENGTARPYAVMNSAAGGENFRIDSMACWDTRPL